MSTTRSLDEIMAFRRALRRRARIGRGLASFSAAMRTATDGHRRMGEAAVTAALAMARLAAALDRRNGVQT